MNIGETYGCLTLIGLSPPNQQPDNGHQMFIVECNLCGERKHQRSDRIKKCPSHCGTKQCRTIAGIDIYKRREIEYQLWCTIREMKKLNSTWYYIWKCLQNDDRWSATPLKNVTPRSMCQWYSRLSKQFSETSNNIEQTNSAITNSEERNMNYNDFEQQFEQQLQQIREKINLEQSEKIAEIKHMEEIVRQKEKEMHEMKKQISTVQAKEEKINTAKQKSLLAMNKYQEALTAIIELNEPEMLKKFLEEMTKITKEMIGITIEVKGYEKM